MNVTDDQIVAHFEHGFFLNSISVQKNAIGAAQIANDERVIDLRDAAMLARDLSTVSERDITIGLTADQHDGLF